MEEEVEAPPEIDEEETLEEMEDESSQDVQHEMMDILALPIRAKPLFHNNHEDVEEFPLSESKDGLTSTSIVVGDGLFRVVKTTLHQDGVPRIDVQLVMDSELTSFQHTIDKPTPIEFGLAGGFAVAGLILMMVQGLTPIVLGLGLFLVGLKFLPTHLERHRLIFSSCGNSHEISLGTWGLFAPGFRASMALIGQVWQITCELGTLMSLKSISCTNNYAHQSCRRPLSNLLRNYQHQLRQLKSSLFKLRKFPLKSGTGTTTKRSTGSGTRCATTSGFTSFNPGTSRTCPCAATTSYCTSIDPPGLPSPPMMNPSPPAPLPPPLAPLPAGPPGMNQPIPLDMPMPEAPRIAVQGTPSDEPLITKEEQDALLDELS